MSEKMACKVNARERKKYMAEEEKKDVTNEEENKINSDDVTSTDEDEDSEETDNQTNASEGSAKTNEEEKSDSSKLDKEKNARFAEMRRRKEAEDKAKKEQQKREEQIKRDAKLEAELELFKKNTYTGKEIKDAIDLEIYKMQRELDEQGKDPNADLPEYMAKKQREKEAELKKVRDENDKFQHQLAEEIAELRKAYPDVDTTKLADDELFNQIVDEKKGRWTVLEIYEEKNRREVLNKKHLEENKTSKQIENLTKNSAKQPSSAHSGSSEQDDIMATKDPVKWNAHFRNKYGA